jgi:hypothetical protein
VHGNERTENNGRMKENSKVKGKVIAVQPVEALRVAGG